MEEMEKDAEVPLPARRLKVGIVYNLKHGVQADAPDAEAELDHISTVEAIGDALAAGGYETALLEADEKLVDKLAADRPDVVFNIAEGLHGRGREAQVPAMLSFLGIPYTGSDETTLCIALDKMLTKQLLAPHRVRTPRAAVAANGKMPRGKTLTYPVIVKPNCEGSSKGISDVSIASSKEELAALLDKDDKLYHEELLVEEYIEGREFTVGLLGNGPETRVFSPMEILYKQPTQGSFHVYSYNVKQDYEKYVAYECPAKLTKEQNDEMVRAARKVFLTLGCRDFARADFRMDAQGRIYFIEINPLPGLAPHYSDYPMLAEFLGVPYEKLVQSVLACALRRLGIGGEPQ